MQTAEDRMLHLLKTVDAYFRAGQLCDQDGKPGKDSHLHRQIMAAIKDARDGAK